MQDLHPTPLVGDASWENLVCKWRKKGGKGNVDALDEDYPVNYI